MRHQIDESWSDGHAAPNGHLPTFDRRTVGAILEFLAEPAVADAIRIETAGDKRAAAALGLLAETVEPMAPRPARPALRWLQAIAHERLGEIRTAEKTLNEAESLDPSCPLTLVSLARYAGDRGDAERGLALLRRANVPPDDEMVLAEQWLLVERSVHEVVSVRRGRGMTMRDLRTGDVHEVREETVSRQVRAGQLYCARVVPAAETMQIFGGLEPVAIGERDALIALLDDSPDPFELVAFLSRRFAPPQLRNTEGESLAMCEATLRLTDPVAVSEALDQEYDRRDDRSDDNPGCSSTSPPMAWSGSAQASSSTATNSTSTRTARPVSIASWPGYGTWIPRPRCWMRPVNPQATPHR